MVMESNSQKFGHSQKLVAALAMVAILALGGCGDFLTGKTAGKEANKIIKEVGKFELAPEPNIPLPQFYKEPPKIVEQIVGGAAEWKLFYFCKYHTSDELKKIVHEQFGIKIFEKPDKPPTVVQNYTVSSNPATNQLIVRCPTLEDINAVLETLALVDVPPVQVKIDCIISEVYADRTLDWETTLKITELFGEGIWVEPAGGRFGETVGSLLQRALVSEAAILPAFPGASLRELYRARMGLKVGYATNKYLALVNILESQGYLKILMNPTLEIVNGRTAKVSSTQRVPLQRIINVSSSVYPLIQEQTEYVDVIDSLEITPHVFFGDDSVGLETKILLGSKLTPEGVKQLPIVTKKEIDNKENRIRRGESLIIGGIRKSEERDVTRGLPGLKNLPIVGMLFSGRDFEERVVETIFILTPYISTGGVPSTEMAENIKRKHEAPPSDANQPAIMDPFGLGALKKEYQRKTAEAEQARMQAEVEKAEARGIIREADQKTKQAQAETERIKVQAEKITSVAEKTKADAEKLMAEAKKFLAEAEAKAKAAEEAKAASDKAAQEAAAAKAAADRIAADATKTKEEAQKALAEAEAKAKAAEQAKVAADKAVAEAATAKVEAEKIKAEAEKQTAEKAPQDPNTAQTEPQNEKQETDKAEAEKPKEDNKA